ncbi:MAG: DUF1810 family protein [Ruminococcus sp.]|nr:DUF1810 family protein [Ruminococcus sp.]
MSYDLSRFISAHQSNFECALSEIKKGRKESHWMWYIFPQIKGLGRSYNSNFYGITDLNEAKAFLNNEYLGSNIKKISHELLQLKCSDARLVMGTPDNMKLKSSMTLFAIANQNEAVFNQVLEKFFDGKKDRLTLKLLGLEGEKQEDRNMDSCTTRIIDVQDDNIHSIRERYTKGLHFVVGDTHGEVETLHLLMKKIEFDFKKDHVYFVGDYNAGGKVTALLNYIAQYYQEDFNLPGFHLIRGNHERELSPIYRLENMPDIIVVRGNVMNYYIVHAGMVYSAFDLINEDMRKSNDKQVYAYSIMENAACYDVPLRQITWSRNGLYSQRSRYHVWPSEESLHMSHACIIHGHTPFSMLKHGNYFSYGDRMLLWKNQKIWFAEDLQSFNIDSNVKGRFDAEDNYRGLSCVCLEIIEKIAEKSNGILKREEILKSENFVFSVPRIQTGFFSHESDLSSVLNAKPISKSIGLDIENNLQIV